MSPQIMLETVSVRRSSSKVRWVAAILASLAVIGALGLAGLRTYRHRQRFDEFGHVISTEPGAGRVVLDSSVAVESAAERARLPEFQDLPAASTADLTPGAVPAPVGADWTRSQGDASSSRYSGLLEINRLTVKELQPAWVYHSGDGAANVQCTPVIVHGVMFAPTSGKAVVALDAATGKERWRFHPEGHPAQRGLTYWPGIGQIQPRLFFTSGPWLYALDPVLGKPVEAFGKGGRVPSGGTVSPVIASNVVVAAAFNVVSGFDIRNGKPLWTFNVLPTANETVPGVKADSTDRGANIWGGMAADQARGIVYVATGAPHPNFIGLDHLGDNRNANSLLALDAHTGRLLWTFQEIRHDIWDLDIPAPPNLVTIRHEGHLVDAVAQVTKLGNTLLLDRMTGKPLFPYRLRRAPTSTLPGERTAPYQAVFSLPEPFTRQQFSPADITDLTPQAHQFVAQQVAKANYGWFQPFAPGKPTIYYNVNGGAEWTGASFDSQTGMLYVSANEIPWIMTVLKAAVREGAAARQDSPGAKLFEAKCAVCHGADRKGKGMAPALLGLGNRMLDDEASHIIQHGRNSMPPIAVSAVQRQQILDYLFDRDLPQDSSAAQSSGKFTYYPNGYPKLMDDNGYPGTKPPWGTLNAIDLNTGKLRWKVPLGEYEELTRRGIATTGTENFGGATATASGLIFCAGTRDLKIRAFDRDNGQQLWEYKLPFGGFAPPAVYEANGHEYVVIAATGGGKLGGPRGDAYVAFALPSATKNLLRASF